ncbi:MAG: hypothetical protein ACPGVS_02730 [Primorskyibacter sp.]
MPSNTRYITSIVTTAQKGRPVLPWERKRRMATSSALPPRAMGAAPATMAAAL